VEQRVRAQADQEQESRQRESRRRENKGPSDPWQAHRLSHYSARLDQIWAGHCASGDSPDDNGKGTAPVLRIRQINGSKSGLEICSRGQSQEGGSGQEYGKQARYRCRDHQKRTQHSAQDTSHEPNPTATPSGEARQRHGGNRSRQSRDSGD
jgi:hypothetical protein